MHYVVESVATLASVYLEAVVGFNDLDFRSGKKIEYIENEGLPIGPPLRIQDSKLEGSNSPILFRSPINFHEKNLQPDDWYSAFHLVSPKIVDALLAVKVTNIELWNAAIEQPSGKKIDFFLINILSPSNCAKVIKIPDLDGGASYNLKVDPSIVGDLKLFRDTANIFVHEDVVKSLSEKAVQGLDFIRVT